MTVCNLPNWVSSSSSKAFASSSQSIASDWSGLVLCSSEYLAQKSSLHTFRTFTFQMCCFLKETRTNDLSGSCLLLHVKVILILTPQGRVQSVVFQNRNYCRNNLKGILVFFKHICLICYFWEQRKTYEIFPQICIAFAHVFGYVWKSEKLYLFCIHI